MLTNVPSPELNLKVTTRSAEDGQGSEDEEPNGLPIKSAVVEVPLATGITTDVQAPNLLRNDGPQQLLVSRAGLIDDDTNQDDDDDEDDDIITPTVDSDTPSPTPVPTLMTLTESLPED